MSEVLATFVVLPTADADQVLLYAEEHASFDPSRRRALRAGDPALRTNLAVPPSAAAVVLNSRGDIVVALEAPYALSEPWIEDAFLRATSSFENR